MSVDRVAANDMLERYTLVPTVPLLLATEGTGHPRTAAPEEIKYALRQYRPLRRTRDGSQSRAA